MASLNNTTKKIVVYLRLSQKADRKPASNFQTLNITTLFDEEDFHNRNIDQLRPHQLHFDKLLSHNHATYNFGDIAWFLPHKIPGQKGFKSYQFTGDESELKKKICFFFDTTSEGISFHVYRLKAGGGQRDGGKVGEHVAKS